MGKGRVTKGMAVAALAMLGAACASSSTSERAEAPQGPPASAVVDYAAATQPIGTRMPRIDGDLCKAADLQWLVGQPRTEIPVPVDVINRRVACTTCPVTEDYSPYRLNIFFDQETGVVQEVRCG